MAIAAVGLATVAIAIIITWLLWPREQAVVSSQQTIHASELTAVNGFQICRPGWRAGRRGGVSFFGNLVVWSVDNDSGSGLMAADLRLHSPFRLYRAARGVSVLRPTLSGDVLAWLQHRPGDPASSTSLWYMDVRKRRPTKVAGREVVIGNVQVAQGRIAWLQGTQSGRDDKIWVYDTATGSRRQIPAVAGPKADVAIDDGLIVWCVNSGDSAGTGIWLYEPMGKTVRRVTRDAVRSLDLSSPDLVWITSGGEVKAYNLASGRRQVLSEGRGPAQDCRVDGSLAVWWDASVIGDVAMAQVGDIYGADLRSGHRFPISMHGSAQPDPQVSGSTVVWPDDSLGYWVLRGAQISL